MHCFHGAMPPKSILSGGGLRAPSLDRAGCVITPFCSPSFSVLLFSSEHMEIKLTAILVGVHHDPGLGHSNIAVSQHWVATEGLFRSTVSCKRLECVPE